MDIEINFSLNTFEAQVLSHVIWNYVDMLEKSNSMSDCDQESVYKVCCQLLYNLPFVSPSFIKDGNKDL